jgi:large subunit ribosomal protein L25
VAGERVKLEVTEREQRGSRDARRLRKQGIVPGVLYGRGNPRAICIPERELRRVLTGPAGLHAILDVVLEGQKTAHPSILKDYQQDPLRGKVIHVDLHEVRLDQPIHASVSVTLVGEAQGVVIDGGVLTQVLREVSIEALPTQIPEHIDVDVSGLQGTDTLRVEHLPPVDGVTYLDDPESVVATVTLPTPEVEEEPAEVEEPPEGEVPPEEQPEGAAEAPAEPEADAAGEPGTVSG